MSWRDLLQENENAVLPWLWGRSLRSGDRVWYIDGPLPRQPGWYEFKFASRKAQAVRRADPNEDILVGRVQGYLVGDRLVTDGTNVNPEPASITEHSEPVALLDAGLDRFVRIVAGRSHEDGKLIFIRQDFPLGPEEAVLDAYRKQLDSVNQIKDVTPALDAAFRMESWQRAEVVRRRAELEKLRREQEEKQAQEERRAQIAQQLGTAVGRRAMAVLDFAEAARAALAAGGAVYLDHRKAHAPGEMVVVFQIDRRQFECVCDGRQLNIIDAGICLTGHATGIRYDDRFTLESLPGVIRQAIREGRLVVFRHVGPYEDNEDDD